MSSRVRNAWVRLPLHGSLILTAIALIACGGGTEPTVPTPEPPVVPPPISPPPASPPIGIAVSPPGLSLLVGAVERLTAQAHDAVFRPISSSFEWSSADPAIATVGRTDGMVTAISAGTTAITATAGTLRSTVAISVIDIAGTIAFSRGTSSSAGILTFDVLSFSLADRTLRSLPRPARFPSIRAAAWSPDGRMLAVEVVHSAFVLPGGEDGFDMTTDLYVTSATDPAGSPWRALTANGRSQSPSWSPDGGRIAYIGPSMSGRGNHIYVVGAGGGEPVQLTRIEGFYDAPRWSPDGTRLAFSALSDGLVGNGEIFIVNADGSGLSNVTRHSASDAEPSWSPDGAHLAFVSDRDASDGTYRRAVLIVDADGDNVVRLTNQLCLGFCWSSGPVWSPDGRQIIFSNRQALYVMNANGSSPIRLTTPPRSSWDHAPALWR